MLKDHFQKSTSTLNILRSQHFKVSEYLNKGKYRLKQKYIGKGKRHYDFDLNTQQFLHQYIDDIIFEQTQIQQTFYNQVYKSLQNPVLFSNKLKLKDQSIGLRKNPSQVRVLLARHFYNRSVDLQYKKYLTLLRVHNSGQQQALIVVNSRTNLIDKQIQQCLSRQTRLQQQDYFEQSYMQGGKPIPINQNGQPIYKYLDQEYCWYSNINRQDIQAYLRNKLFKQQVLKDVYWPYWYQCKYLVFTHGLQLCSSVQDEIIQKKRKIKEDLIQKQKNFIKTILQKGLQDISPGNLQQKQNLNNFIYNITGINRDSPIQIPLYPAVYLELSQQYANITHTFFRHLPIYTHKQIIDLIPKMNNFCSILFKYQNQQILQGEKQIKLGLQDDIDIKKQLITMLEEQWVTKHIKIDYSRFQYRMYLKNCQWTLDTYSSRLEQQIRYKNQNGYVNDSTLQQLLRAIRMTAYNGFRKIMKKRSQKTYARLKNKYEDMHLVQKYSKKSDQQLNMQKLSDLYQTKQSQMKQLFKNSIKESTKKFFDIIISDYLIKNPVQIQIVETLVCIKIRQMRTRILNFLNAFRSYQRNIDMDLRVINGCQFKFELDDKFLINSNKQLIQKFEKSVKDNETTVSKMSKENSTQPPSLQSQQFLMHSTNQKSMMYKKDKVQRHYFHEKIPHVFVLEGKRKKNILYDIALQDLKIIEERILEVGTYFINRYQRVIKMKQMPEIVNRVNVLSQLFQLQEQYHYEKFNLIQSYYYLYQNTTEPLNAQKVSKIIIQLIYQQPKIDINSEYYKQSYLTMIQNLKQENKAIKQLTRMVEDVEKQRNKVFHKKFTDVCKIPLTLWAYAYGDMEVKGGKNYSKLQRMNSVSSKMSRNSKQKNVLNELREQIREEFDEGDEQQEGFDLQKYDEYMLKRNMDDIFQDIVGGNQNPKDKDKQIGVSSLGLENITVNPKFEGGPHCLHNYLPEIKITSHCSQKLINFSQHICIVSNIHHLIKQLSKEVKERYGFCSQTYQLYLKKQIFKMINKILLQPSNAHNGNNNVLQRLHQFKTDDFYEQSVSSDCKVFKEVMSPILNLPSIIQLSIPSTHERNQASLPNQQILQRFDINIISNLIRLQKCLNSTIYRELNLAINLLQFVRLRQRVWHMQHERQQLLLAYRTLGTHCQIPIQKYTNCYGRTGQSEIFMGTSQIKYYNESFLRRPTYNQSIQELRIMCQLQETQIKLFRSNIQITKESLEDYIRIIWDIEKQTTNKILDRAQILRAFDKKTVKMVSNRIKGYLNINASQLLKSKCYLKYKNKIKLAFQQKLKSINQNTVTIQQLVLKNYLNNDQKKFNKNCQVILGQKLKRLLAYQYMKKYTLDLKHNVINNQTFIQLLKSAKQIKRYTQSLPYLSKIFIIPTYYQILNKKAFDDQKKMKVIQSQANHENNINYIQSKDQLLQSWQALTQNGQSNFSTNNLQNAINIQKFVKQAVLDQNLQNNKDYLFKWMFKIPSNNISSAQKQALRHLLRVHEPFTGKISISQYRYSFAQKGSRNKFSQLLQRYTIILQYIESNLLVISLQVDDDILDSLFSILEHGYIFENRYPLIDQGAIYQKDQQSDKKSNKKQQREGLDDQKESIMAPIFIYENKKDQLQNRLKQKITSKGYIANKAHWAVIDEIIDFIVSKVQGYGVLRHSMLQLKDQLDLLVKGKSKEKQLKNDEKIQLALKYMKNKTYNIYSILWLGLQQLNAQTNSLNAHEYAQIFLDTLTHKPKLQQLQTSLNLNMNVRRGISQLINNKQNQIEQQQKIKFKKGVFQLSNNLLTNKLKIVYNFLPFDTNQIIEQYVYKSEKGKQKDKQTGNHQLNELYLIRHNWDHFSNFKQIVKKPGKQFRFQLFAKMRQLFIRGKKFVQTKAETSDKLQIMELQQKKVTFFDYLLHSKINLIALTAFKLAKNVKEFPNTIEGLYKRFKQDRQESEQSVQINTFNIYNQLQQYQSGGKILFNKTQSAIIMKGAKNSLAFEQNNKLVRLVIFNKLVIEQFKHTMLSTAIKLLQNQKLPQKEAPKVKNNSLISRVKLISSFSSPLIVQRKTYISQQHKLAFVQVFINRFRNKVSRVDLLSSGYGFVITVPDLEDCVNYMNKMLFTFTQKQFRARLDTFSEYYEILLDGIRSRNQTIIQQKSIIKYLQDKLKNTLQADYLSKVSKMLQEKVIIQEKLLLAEQASNGLEQRVRKTIQHQYDKKITAMQQQIDALKSKNQQFKDLLIKLTKDATKNNFLQLVNILKQQVSSVLQKKVDLTQSFKNISQLNVQSQPKKIKVQQQAIKTAKKQEKVIQNDSQSQQYRHQDVQKCKIGQDIIHDPYYVTKLINKMRLFNLFKMGAKRIKYQNKQEKKISQLTSLHQIQDRVIVQNERQAVLRDELIKAQQQLSKKSIQLQKIKYLIEGLENQKAKMKIILINKQKKLQLKQRENQQFKKKFQQKSAELLNIQSKNIFEKNHQKQQQQLPKLSDVRQKRKSKRKINQTFVTGLQQKSAALSLYQKFELSNKDSTWRQKCQQLYIQNKKLMNQLEKAKQSISATATPFTREGHSLNLRNKRTAQQSEHESSRTEKRKFPNLSFKYGVMKN